MIEIATETTMNEALSVMRFEAPDAVDLGTTYILYRDGVPVGMGGCPQIWEGFGQSWGIVDPLVVAGHGIWLTRQARKGLQIIIKKMNYRCLIKD